MNNLITRKGLPLLLRNLRRHKSKIVFTNGIFDILHRGHVDYLKEAKKMGDVLIVGLNSDASTRRLKGNNRPIFKQNDRAALLLALQSVDPEARASAMGAFQSIYAAGMTLGPAVSGVIARWWGITGVYLANGALLVLAVLIAVLLLRAKKQPTT